MGIVHGRLQETWRAGRREDIPRRRVGRHEVDSLPGSPACRVVPECVHERDCSLLSYNNEQALRAVVKSSLVAAIDDYARMEELPGGKGFADVAYLPARGSDRPALLVELKWNRPTTAALERIRNSRYPASLCGLDVPILLVGITFDAKTRGYECQIEVLDEQW